MKGNTILRPARRVPFKSYRGIRSTTRFKIKRNTFLPGQGGANHTFTGITLRQYRTCSTSYYALDWSWVAALSILCVSARSGAPERHFESRKRSLNPKFMNSYHMPRTSYRLSSAPSEVRATPLQPCERKYNSTPRTTCPTQILQRNPEHSAIQNKKEHIFTGERWRQSHLHRYYYPAVQNLLYELLPFILDMGCCSVNT